MRTKSKFLTWAEFWTIYGAQDIAENERWEFTNGGVRMLEVVSEPDDDSQTL